MGKWLSIIIPHFNEDENIIKNLLDSIAIQQNIDLRNEIEVIICSDGPNSAHLSDEFLGKYTFEIRHLISKEHRGVSFQRNEGLRNAVGDYVAFCDADDMYSHCLGFWLIKRETMAKTQVLINNIPTEVVGFDALYSVFIEEGRVPQTGETFFMDRQDGFQFFHGKIARRKFLIDNDIWQDENCFIHEDHLFNGKISACTNNIKWCPSPFYLWKWRDSSVCRKDPLYIKKTYTDLIKSTSSLVSWLIGKSKFDKAREVVCQIVYDAYYTFCHPSWKTIETKEYRDKTEKYFAEYFKKYKYLWDEAPDQLKMAISNGIRQRVVAEGMEMETETLQQFLERIKQL